MSVLLFLRLPRPRDFMERELGRLKNRLPLETAPVFHTDKTIAFLIPDDGPLTILHRRIERELMSFEDWDLIELGRHNISKHDGGVVNSWMDRVVRFITGQHDDDAYWDERAEEFRRT